MRALHRTSTVVVVVLLTAFYAIGLAAASGDQGPPIHGLTEACSNRVYLGEAAPGPAAQDFREECIDPSSMVHREVEVAAAIHCEIYTHAPFPVENDDYPGLNFRGIGFGGFVACSGSDTMVVIELRQKVQLDQRISTSPNQFIDGTAEYSKECTNTNLCVSYHEFPCPGRFKDNQRFRNHGSTYFLAPTGYFPAQLLIETNSPNTFGSELCRPGLTPLEIP